MCVWACSCVCARGWLQAYYTSSTGSKDAATRVPEPLGLNSPPILPCTILLARALLGLGQGEHVSLVACCLLLGGGRENLQLQTGGAAGAHGLAGRSLQRKCPCVRARFSYGFSVQAEQLVRTAYDAQRQRVVRTSRRHKRFRQLRMARSVDVARAALALADILRLKEGGASEAVKLCFKVRVGWLGGLDMERGGFRN